MSNREPKLPTSVLYELADLDWHWEIGAKHWKLFIDNRMVGIWPRGSKQDVDRRPIQNLVAQIRRMKRQVA
jgi:hypothetical protein